MMLDFKLFTHYLMSIFQEKAKTEIIDNRKTPDKLNKYRTIIVVHLIVANFDIGFKFYITFYYQFFCVTYLSKT